MLGAETTDPGTRRAERGTEHHDLGHVLGPGLAAQGDPSPDARHRRASGSRRAPTTLSYALDSPLIPSTQEVLTIPGGSAGVHATDGAILATSHTVTFDVAAGDTLRLQQLLAGLNYLPVGFTATGPAPARADLAQDQAGTFSWRWPGLPTELTSQWTQGTQNMITKAAVEAFETQNGLGVDGIAGPGRLDRADQRHHQRQARRHPLRLRAGQQGAARRT